MRVKIIEPKIKAEVAKKKVCAYARVSTDDSKQGESLENQMQYYENVISNNPEYEYAGTFADKGSTGTTDNRPEFQRMLQLCREGKVDLILTKSISRFARNTTIVLETVRELKAIGVEVRFEKENIETMSGDGELMLTILSSFAEEESRSISENVKWSIRNKYKRGELMINTDRFLGYDKDDNGNLVINQEEARVVKRIFEEYLVGKSASNIAKELNHQGEVTATGNKWQESPVLYILKNEKYKGDALLQKYYILDHLKKRKVKNKGEVNSFYIEENHLPIISKETWEQVQSEMQKRAAAKGNLKGSEKYSNRYPLTGMLYCSKCGYVLKRRTWNSKLSCKKIVWQCSNYIKNGKIACEGTSIDDGVISRVDIKEPTVVKEVIKNGKKHHSYTSKDKQDQSCGKLRTTEKEDGSILQGINRSIRTVIEL